MRLDELDPAWLESNLLPRSQWHPFPPATDRDGWAKPFRGGAGEARARDLLAAAGEVFRESWPGLPATLYMDFARTGNRIRYEKPYFLRRHRLGALVAAECAQHRGAFLDPIADGLACILEEPTWCIPAHATRYGDDPLPAHDVASVDLFACETAMVCAESLYLLGAELRDLSPSLYARLLWAVDERVVAPVEIRDDFGWLGGVNNWTPWCASNVLGAAMYIVDDPARLARITAKLGAAVQRFIDRYGDDGGCDEGPSYWGVAAGAMLVFLELLHSRTDGRIDLYDDPKIRRMGRFLTDVHIAGPWFVNFADAAARLVPRIPVVYRYGERIGEPPLRALAVAAMHGWRTDGGDPLPITARGTLLPQVVRELFWIPAGVRPEPIDPRRVAWLPDLQVLVARENADAERGLVIAAKGGHNEENHNHNDIGQFVVYADGEPVVVDVGVETYSRRTFSERRYEIWCIRSSGHDVPLISGIEQAPGREFHATDVVFRESDDSVSLRMDIAGAYPAEAGLRSIKRAISLERGEPARAIVRDCVEIDGDDLDLCLPLFVRDPVTPLPDGALAVGEGGVVIEYPADLLDTEIYEIPIDDERLRASWGERLYRVDFRWRHGGSRAEYELRFRARGPSGVPAPDRGGDR